MYDNEDKQWLYGKFVDAGLDIGTYEGFDHSLQNDEDKKWYYEKATGMGLDVGTYDEFDKVFGKKPRQTKPSNKEYPITDIRNPQNPMHQPDEFTPPEGMDWETNPAPATEAKPARRRRLVDYILGNAGSTSEQVAETSQPELRYKSDANGDLPQALKDAGLTAQDVSFQWGGGQSGAGYYTLTPEQAKQVEDSQAQINRYKQMFSPEIVTPYGNEGNEQKEPEKSFIGGLVQSTKAAGGSIMNAIGETIREMRIARMGWKADDLLWKEAQQEFARREKEQEPLFQRNQGPISAEHFAKSKSERRADDRKDDVNRLINYLEQKAIAEGKDPAVEVREKLNNPNNRDEVTFLTEKGTEIIDNNSAPLEGAAKLGALVPMAATTAASIGLAATGNPAAAKGFADATLGMFAASSAGSAMKQARDAGATNAQTFAAGLASGAIMYGFAKIPMGRYIKQAAAETAAQNVTSIVSKDASRELQVLLEDAAARGYLTKETASILAKQWAENAATSTASFAAMSGVEAIVPLVYEDPDKYPVLSSVFNAAVSGAEDGLIMGTLMGGLSSGANVVGRARRWQQQGEAYLAEVQSSGNDVHAVWDQKTKTWKPLLASDAPSKMSFAEILGYNRDEKTGGITGDLIMIQAEDGNIYLADPSIIKIARKFSAKKADAEAKKAYRDSGYDAGEEAQTPEQKTEVRVDNDYQTKKAEKEAAQGGVSEGTQLDVDRANAAMEGRRDTMRSQLEQRIGKPFWTGANGSETVDVVELQDGRTVFVLSEDEKGVVGVDKDGKPVMIDKDGDNIFQRYQESLNEYLDAQVYYEDQIAEHERMIAEQADNVTAMIEKVQQDGRVNLSAEENPVWGTLVSVNPAPDGGITVQVEGEANPRFLNWKETSSVLGIPFEGRSNEDLVNEKLRMDDQVANYNENIPVDSDLQVQLDGGDVVTYKFKDAEVVDGEVIVHGEDTESGEVVDILPEMVTNLDALVNGETPAPDVDGNPVPAASSPAPAPEETAPVFTDPVANELGIDKRYAHTTPSGDVVVDGRVLWNENPELWAEWNDRNPNRGISTKEYLEDKQQKATQEAQTALDAYKAEWKGNQDPDVLQTLKAEMDKKTDRLQRINDLVKKYDDAEKAAQLEKEQPAPVEEARPAFATQAATPKETLQNELSDIDARIKKSPVEQKQELLQQRNSSVQRYVDGARVYGDTEATTISELANRMTAEGVDRRTSVYVQDVIDRASKRGEVVRGVTITKRDGNKKAFLISDNLRDAVDVNGALVHEEWHIANGSNGLIERLIATEGIDKNNMLAAISYWSRGSKHYDSNKSTEELADEYIAMAMEAIDGIADEGVAAELAKAGVNNEEIVNFVKTHRNERGLLQGVSDTRRDRIGYGNSSVSGPENGGDSIQRPEGNLGQSGPGSLGSSGDGTGAGEQVTNIENGRRGQYLPESRRDSLQPNDSEVDRGQDVRNPETGSGALEGQLGSSGGSRPSVGAGEAVESPAAEAISDRVGDNATPEEIRLNDAGVASNPDEARLSVRYAPTEEEAKQIAQDIATETGVPVKKAEDWVKSETSLAAIILDEHNAPYLNYVADDRYTAIKNDSDYPQGTVDFNNICRKRLAFTGMFQRIQNAFPNTVITGRDLAIIRQIMKDHGETVSCGLCYVEDRRQLLGEIANGFINDLRDGFKGYSERKGFLDKPNDNGNKKARKKVADELLRLVGNDTKEDLSIYDLLTLDGSQRLYDEHRGIYDAFQRYNSARGQQAGNLFQGYAEYKREILKWTPAKVASVNGNGGLRVFSYSDFEAHHLIDLVQIIQDCARKGVMIQGYTKVPAFARAVANTGIKLNRSLIPLGDTGIVDGKLAYDPVEGIDINDPDFLESNDNIGNILIGINDEQIALAMRDPFIHYIIPYHSNQSGVLRQMKQTGAWTNYKNEQLEKGGKEVNIYKDVLAAAEAEGKPIKNERQFVNKFLQVCRERGLTPRFSRFLNVDSKGNFAYRQGYYKLLLDFKLFDENGKILPQKPVVAKFDDDFNAKILQDYVAGEESKGSNVSDEIYNEIVEKLGLERRDPGIQFSIVNRSQDVFVSNAQKAVEGIKMDKATPEQWLKMIEKGGGLKAGEDKWIGLSDWLRGSDRKSLTKQEVSDFIEQNRIRIEEVKYGGSLKDEIRDTIGRGRSLDELQREIDEIRDSEEYKEIAGDDIDDSLLTETMVDRYGDDFELGYIIDTEGKIDYQIDPFADEDFRANQVGDTRPIHNIRLGYTTEGLENNREIALTVPTIEPWNESDEIHFGDAGEGRAVAWIRFGDATVSSAKNAAEAAYREADKAWRDYRNEIVNKYALQATCTKTTKDLATPEENARVHELRMESDRLYHEWRYGRHPKEKVLVIDEIQSKRHQEGREHGYKNQKAIATLQDKADDAKKAYDEYIDSLKEKYGGFNGMAGNITEEENRRAEELNDAHIAAQNAVIKSIGSVPAAPFEKNWHELAMKRMLRLAAEEGYDYVAWTTGEQQAERYSLGGVVNKIEVSPANDGTREVTIESAMADIYLDVDGQGTIVGQQDNYGENLRGKKLSDVVGKEMAARIMGLAEDETISGDGLRVGGEGMKGFYDDILPRFMNKYGKKWGTKVEDLFIPNIGEDASAGIAKGLTMHAVPVTEEMKESVMEGQPMFSIRGGDELIDNGGATFSIVSDPKLIEELEASEKVTGIREVVKNPDGSYSSPMAGNLGRAKTNKSQDERRPTSKFYLQKWNQSEENPDLADENGKIKLIKTDNSERGLVDVDAVDYNPYIHLRLTAVNKQFKDAWKRPDLVYIESEVPKSEVPDFRGIKNVEDKIGSPYHAEKAALPVGIHDWNGGALMLSRYDKPVGEIDWEEVADAWANDEDIRTNGAPFDIVNPQLLQPLVDRGIEIVAPSKGKDKNEAYKAWKAGDMRTYEAWRDTGKAPKKLTEAQQRRANNVIDYLFNGAESIGAGFDSAIEDLNKDGISVDDKALIRGYNLSNVTLSKKGDVVILDKLVVADQNNGNGTRFMNNLIAEADANGWTLALTPDDSFGATSVKRLKDFYKRFGFKDNKGRNTDFTINESMVRRPNDGARFSITAKENEDYMNAVNSGDMDKAQELVDRAAEQAGYTIHAYHGTARADRVGNVFRPDRATSGPMAFFTDDRTLAEGYARGKQDTSVAYDSDYDSYQTQFRTRDTKTGKDYSVYDIWNLIPFSERRKIEDKAKHIRGQWEEDGAVIYDPKTDDANGGWSYQVSDNRGNILRALNTQWLESGNLFGRENDYLKVLELAGVNEALEKMGFEAPRYMDPEYREEAVYDVHLRIQNPFDVAEMVNDEFISGLRNFADEHEQEYMRETAAADSWDKNSITAEEFIENVERDIEQGTSYAWTQIPDVVTAYLKELGHDGIKDQSGKFGGEVHTVWIPFSSEQIKRTDAVTYDDNGNVIPLDRRFDRESNDIRFSVTAEKDTEYMEAANAGDEKRAQELVLDAAKKAGYGIEAYHGSFRKGFTKFDDSQKWSDSPAGTYWFTSKEAHAETYRQDDGELFHVVLSMNNPIEIDAEGLSWDQLPAYYEVYFEKADGTEIDENFDTYKEALDFANENGIPEKAIIAQGEMDSNAWAKRAIEKGYDGLIIRNVSDIYDTLGENVSREDEIADDYVVFNPDQIKSADPITRDDSGNIIPLSERFNERNDDIRFSLRGVIGAANDETAMQNLDIAKEMEQAGKDAKTIWAATGWENGVDGKWRNEIKDATPKEIAKGKRVFKVGDIIDASDLFASYPEIKDYKVTFKKIKGAVGQFMREDKTVAIDPDYGLTYKLTEDQQNEVNKATLDYIRNEGVSSERKALAYKKKLWEETGERTLSDDGLDTILHELQHAIQAIEGFAKGGNTNNEKTRIFRDAIDKDPISGSFGFFFCQNNPASKLWKAGRKGVTAGIARSISTMSVADQELLRNLSDYLSNCTDSEYLDLIHKGHQLALEAKQKAQKNYHNLAGEVEARNVSARHDMSEEDRAAIPPSETEGVPRDEQGIRFSIAYHGSPADFTEFEEGHYREGVGSFHRPGFYFASDEKSARPYAYDRGNGAFMYEVELPDDNGTNYIHVFRTIPKSQRRELAERIQQLFPEKGIDVEKKIVNKPIAGEDLMGMFTNDELEKLGYVGIVGPMRLATMPEQQYIMFNPKDIKMLSKTNVTTDETTRLSVVSREDAIKSFDEEGLAGVIGEENVAPLMRSVYAAIPRSVKAPIVDKALTGMDFRKPLNEYLHDLAAKGTENDETGLLFAMYDEIRALTGNPELTDGDIRYMIWKSTGESNGDILSMAEDIAMKNRWNVGKDEPRYSVRKQDLTEVVEDSQEKLDEKTAAAAEKLKTVAEAVPHMSDLLNPIVTSMAAQKEYDRATVDGIVDFAKQVLKNGGVSTLTTREFNRLLTIIKSSTGKSPKSVTKYSDELLDKLIDHMVKDEQAKFDKLINVKDVRLNQSGVAAVGSLDVSGQITMRALRDYMFRPQEEIDNRIAEVENKFDSSDKKTREDARAEFEGLKLASDYQRDLAANIKEGNDLENELDEAKDAMRTGDFSRNDYAEFAKVTEQQIRENKIARVDLYRDFKERLAELQKGSKNRAHAFREAERERVERIHHLANLDMQGTPNKEHLESSWKSRALNSTGVRFFLKPLATFDQMLRLFGRSTLTGEGFLYNHFGRGWIDAREKELIGKEEAIAELDKKVKEIFDDPKMQWSKLYDKERKMKGATVYFFDGGEKIAHDLTPGNLLYIYMANKMVDGKMKLRRMGISEEDVQAIQRSLDPEFIELADWIQSEFLPKRRAKYNAVHEEMFGASMAAIDDYFPLKILSNARVENIDLADDPGASGLTSTTTGSIIKRQKNSLALDLLNTDAFNLVVEHVEEMENWAAFAKLRRDMNTLLSYKRFRNQVQNMDTVYGSGKVLWDNFRDVASVAMGNYRPKVGKQDIDTLALNVAKGVTGAKISFRIGTALKQFLSAPAFLSDARLDDLVKNLATAPKAWTWCMENLPIFRERWNSRFAGDTRLMKTESDWKLWKTKLVREAGKWGMSPNAFVDALTVAVGAKSMYDTNYRRYVEGGYSEEEANRKAKQDATILYNQTQQSSEAMFTSAMQLDRTLGSVILTVFRNSSMGYNRQTHDALRIYGRMMQDGYKERAIERMTRQRMEDGLSEDEAKAFAEKEYNRQYWRSAARIGVFAFLLPLAWNYGIGDLLYLLFGDDDKEKEKIHHDALMHTLAGPVEGLTAGSVISSAWGTYSSTGKTENISLAELPIESDMAKILSMVDYDAPAAIAEIVNLIVQSGIGVNPQTFTDAIVATIDAFEGDMGTAKEFAIWLMRVNQLPRPSIERFLVDEFEMTPDEAKAARLEDLAKRYADYKMRKGAISTLWMYDPELEEKRRKSYEKKFKKKVTDRENLHVEDQENN